MSDTNLRTNSSIELSDIRKLDILLTQCETSSCENICIDCCAKLGSVEDDDDDDGGGGGGGGGNGNVGSSNEDGNANGDRANGEHGSGISDILATNSVNASKEAKGTYVSKRPMRKRAENEREKKRESTYIFTFLYICLCRFFLCLQSSNVEHHFGEPVIHFEALVMM